MVTVWERLGEMFGPLFENGYGDAEGSAIETWTRGLADYSETSIRAALDLLVAWEKPFPPTLGEFANLCRSYRPAVPVDRQIVHRPRASRETREYFSALQNRILRGDYPSDEELEGPR
jgi:hypothetical protein